MNKKFVFEFVDEAPKNALSYEYEAEDSTEKMQVVMENGSPVLYANQQGCLVLAKAFIKLAICDYKEGFHIHLHKDFDGDQPETIRVGLVKD